MFLISSRTTLALVFVTVHVLRSWESFSGGLDGKSVSDASLWFIVDFENLSIFGKDFTEQQGIYYLVWIFVGLTTLWLAIWEETLSYVEVDVIHIWEDISAAKDSMVGAATVKEFMVPYYQQVSDFAKGKGAERFIKQ